MHIDVPSFKNVIFVNDFRRAVETGKSLMNLFFMVLKSFSDAEAILTVHTFKT
jgi:hypothetical protein